MKPRLLHHLLQPVVDRTPDKVAIVAPSGSLTYRQLDEQSSRLALVLRENGVTTGDRVGFDLEKSGNAVVAIFGILKAGAAYVPLDPRAPARRSAYVIDNCRMRVLVTTRARAGQLEPHVQSMPGTVLRVDGDPVWERVSNGPGLAPPVVDQTETDLAYILYTSGSTGEPKGVMLSHRAALTFVNWAVSCFALQPDDVFSSHAPFHFNLSILDLFAAFAVGGCVCIVPHGVAMFPRSLADWIERSGLSVWYSVPSVLTQLALKGGMERHAYARLRLVLFAGEVFPIAHLALLMQKLPGPAYFNLYGPTETNVCTVYAVPPGRDEPLPIGRACAECEVFAVTDDGARAGAGESGELFVGGPSLMSGYWGRPEQTEKVLVPNPLIPVAGERVYRTGDLVRLDEAGHWHFIGRRDLQVKSRGYRIELGDIETVLHRHPQVAEAAVVPVPHEEFGCTLRGVISLQPGGTAGRTDLAAFCAEHLPPYMVPDEFEFRETLPKTSSGKLDRAALRNPV